MQLSTFTSLVNVLSAALGGSGKGKEQSTPTENLSILQPEAFAARIAQLTSR